jgi:hypothetical protein
MGFYLREYESKHLDFFYGTSWVSIKVPHKKKTTLLFRKQQQKQHCCFVHENYLFFGVFQHSKQKNESLVKIWWIFKIIKHMQALSQFMPEKKFWIRGPSKKHLSDRQKFLSTQIFQNLLLKIVFFWYQEMKKWPHKIRDDQISFFLELVHNIQIYLTEISGTLGPLTTALLRRKIFKNHEK